MYSGHDHLTGYNEKIDADYKYWVSYVYKNFDTALKIVMQTMTNDKLICFICEDYSLNFHTLGSLASHYRGTHKQRIIDYYIKHLIKKTPEQLKEMMNHNTHSVNSIERGLVHN